MTSTPPPDRASAHAVNEAENPHAGKGTAVVLDIGGDIGALIVTMPAGMADLEVEIIPTGTDARTGAGRSSHHHPHGDHSHGAHEHDHGHDHPHGHNHDPLAPPHVAVVERPLPDGGTQHSLVYDSVQAGTYDLYVRPDGPVRVTATVRGGEVTFAAWPPDGAGDTGAARVPEHAGAGSA